MDPRLRGNDVVLVGRTGRFCYLNNSSLGNKYNIYSHFHLSKRGLKRVCRKAQIQLIQSDGQVAWQWAYSAFGEEKPTIAKNRFANTDLNQSFGTTSVPAVTFNLRYPGQYFDQETGLHYNWHRSYDAGRGRYTQADPIGLDGGWNRFGYLDADSINFFDTDGLAKNDPKPTPTPIVPYPGGGKPNNTGGAFKPIPFPPPFVGGGTGGGASRVGGTPSTGQPGSWYTNPGNGQPGNGQERLYGPNGRPMCDIDWHPDHGAGKPHGHNWGADGRGPGVPLSPWPQGRTTN